MKSQSLALQSITNETKKALSPSSISSGCPLSQCKDGNCTSSLVDASLDTSANLRDVERLSYQRVEWDIVGMDCPSCASKVETAMSKIEGIGKVEVNFMGEKLFFFAENEAVKSLAEQKIKQLGFSITSKQSMLNSNVTRSKWGQWRQRAYFFRWLLSLGVLLLLSFALSQYSFFYGQLAYLSCCLLGLAPIVKKSMAYARNGLFFSIELLMTVAAFGAIYLGQMSEAAMVLFLFMIGEKLEYFAGEKARSGMKSLAQLLPAQAIKIEQGQKIRIHISDIKRSDVLEVLPGERLAADGLLLTSGLFDESALTGESIPVTKPVGAKVMAGTIALDQAIEFKVTSEQGENSIDKILKLIEQAQSTKAPIERFIAKFSRIYTPMVILMALTVIVLPPIFWGWSWNECLYRGLTLLLIACPCALVISTPAAITSGLSMAARCGILIKGGIALEQLSQINAFAFDKTGTLTKGEPEITDVMGFTDWQSSDLISVIAAVESGSNHPLALAVVKYAQQKGIVIVEALKRRTVSGVGVEGEVRGKRYQLAAPHQRLSLIDKQANSLAIKSAVEALTAEAKTLALIIEEDQIIGLIAWQDTLRQQATSTIALLTQKKHKLIMLTGDNHRSAKAFADKLGLDFKAQLLPQDKLVYIEALAKEHKVAMVGDGINDAPAMKAATLGIAMGSGSDIALDSADVAIIDDDLAQLVNAISFAKKTRQIIYQNISIALGLKGVFLVTTLLGVSGLGLAVFADSGATVLVTLNALRLLRQKVNNQANDNHLLASESSQ